MENDQPINVDIWSDFTSPYCFLTALRLEKLAASENLHRMWVAFLVRPHGAPAMSEEQRATAESQRTAASEAIRKEFGLELKPGPVDIDTYDAHLVMAYATRSGRGPVLLLALMRAYWLEAKDIGKRETIQEVAASAGVGADESAYAWQDPKNVHHVERGMEIGVGHGIHSVPTHIFGIKYLLTGAMDYSDLEATVAKLREETRKAG
ncbi:MAG TPA: DsbA family protein [Gammaproteobacteria bacterium]|nr:DsbA family protein [Gammaproteobacteria bacterium]